MSTRVPYSTVDILVLRVDPTQICNVTENQIEGDTHVKVRRTGQVADELVRNEDVMPLSMREVNHESL